MATDDQDYYEGLYDAIPRDANADSFNEIFDPAGVFGFGSGTRNAEIDKREALINANKNKIGQARTKAVNSAVQGNAADWGALKKSIYGESGNDLSNFYSGLEGKDQAALQDLNKTLGSYKNSADFFNDPNFMGYVGDIENQAQVDPATLAAEKSAMSQFGALTKPQETAEEKFQRLMAQREAEANQRGDREAMASRLKARGAYGSGQELVSALMSQSSNAQNRSLANAAANANASKRAMSALGGYADVAKGLAGQQLQQGSLANQAQMFNKGAKQGSINARGQQQVAATQAGQNALAHRAGAQFQGNTSVNNAARGDKTSQINTGLGVTGGVTGNRTQGANMMGANYDAIKDDLTKQAAVDEASRPTGGLLSRIF